MSARVGALARMEELVKVRASVEAVAVLLEHIARRANKDEAILLDEGLGVDKSQ